MKKTGICCWPYKRLLTCQLFGLICTDVDGEISILEMRRTDLLDLLFATLAEGGIKADFSKRRRLRMIL